MINTNALDAAECVANVESYLKRQYYRRPQTKQTRRDGLIVIAAWCVVVWILAGK